MAITKLLHMKESPIVPSNHLKDTINYILDVKNEGKKTEYGLWTGGNVGTDADIVYHKFMETKRAWGKMLGRQGYHFVISFAPGETNEATCYEVLRKFCEIYLGNNYEYVFAVHNDKDHIHGHIVFNSVSRTTGYKYRYENGDWEKYIQPITDKITKEHGLNPLQYEEERKGKSHGEWAAEKKEQINWTTIIRADVDLAIKNSSNMEEFFLVMKEMGYNIRPGTHKKGDGTREPYFTFCFTDDNGKVHKRRSYNLLPKTEEYSIANIKARIEDKSKTKVYYYEQVALLLERKLFLRLGSATRLYGFNTYGRLYQAVSYYKLPNPFSVPPYQVRADIVRIDKLIDECIYIKNNPFANKRELVAREEIIEDKLKNFYIQRKALRSMKDEFGLLVPKEISDEYFRLRKQISDIRKEDDTWENIADELEEMEKDLPEAFITIMDDLVECEAKIKLVRNEKKILERIIQMEGGNVPGMDEQVKRSEFENNFSKKRSEKI